MFQINDNYCKLPGSYLFSEIARRINKYLEENPGTEVIRMGIGDVTRPICPASIEALHKAVEDQSKSETFHGYGPEQGYSFLIDKIVEYDYAARGVKISPDEVFISDGAKCDTGNIGDILSSGNRVAVTDPVYPVYIDTNVMGGRGGNLLADGCWSNIEYLPCNAENGFIPSLPKTNPDIIYLCYPNNPTGTTLNRDQLKQWVDYCREKGALLLYDSAYEAFITDPDIPHTIYEVEGADEVAIEFRSFSKTAGFTGLRLGYAVVPKKVCGIDRQGNKVSLNPMWNRRQCTKFNGASYLTQRAAEAIYTPEGHRQAMENIEYYLRNAATMRRELIAKGYEVYGGENSPYVWLRTPDGMKSWDFFDKLLKECNVVGTPGAGFGPSGEGYLRLTAFNTYENTVEAMRRIPSVKRV